MAKKTETGVITVRIPAETRYLLEIACRKKRKTLAKYIEDAIDSTFKDVKLKGNTSVNSDRESLWDENEVERFLYLSENYPELLTDTETKIKNIVENFKFENTTFYTKKAKGTVYIDNAFTEKCWKEIEEFAKHLSDFSGFNERDEELKPKAQEAKKALEKAMKKYKG